ncbi:hypothetical protein Pelo_1321 [Pelomyxa schiedti]|nr:hypothetical protein Pelo_1321 [Pelomyxa schiedti]
MGHNLTFEKRNGGVSPCVSDPVEKNPFLKYLDSQALSNTEPSDPTDNDALETPALEPLPVFSLESSVNVWSDFLKIDIHPKSVFLLPGVHHEIDAFDTFNSGSITFSGELNVCSA